MADRRIEVDDHAWLPRSPPGLISSSTPSESANFLQGQSSYSYNTSARNTPLHLFSSYSQSDCGDGDGGDEECDVDCTLSLGTAATRKSSGSHAVPSQMSRSGSPVRAADQYSGWGGIMWPSGSAHEPKIMSSASVSGWDRSSHEGYYSGGYMAGANGVSNCRTIYPQEKDVSSRTWSNPCAASNSQVLNEAILKLLPQNRDPETLSLSSWNPMYCSSREESDPAGSRLQLPPTKAFMDQCSVARACAHCGTTKTPLWRNGPLGPKSLCNACGIRYKKVGRRICGNGVS